MKRTMMIILILGALGALTGTSVAKHQELNERSTEAVWQHHIEAWGDRNLEEIVDDYDGSSIMVINGKIYSGLHEIRLVFQSLFRIFDKGENEIDPTVVKGKLVYITWHFTPKNLSTFFGTDTFIIDAGKIKIQTIASPLYDMFPVEGGI